MKPLWMGINKDMKQNRLVNRCILENTTMANNKINGGKFFIGLD